MITTRTAKQCGQADFGWLQARYTFSFGHYFDPKLLGYASLRVLNQEVLAPGASFQPFEIVVELSPRPHRGDFHLADPPPG